MTCVAAVSSSSLSESAVPQNVTNTDEQSTKALIPQTDHKTCCDSQNLVNCCTTVQTSWTANPQQPEVIEFEYYHRWMRNKLCASSNDVSTIVGVICKLNCRQVLLIWLGVAKLSKPRVWAKVPEGSTLISGGTWRTGPRKLACQKLARFVWPFLGLWRMDRGPWQISQWEALCGKKQHFPTPSQPDIDWFTIKRG